MTGLSLPESPRLLIYSTDDPPSQAARRIPFLRALRDSFPDAHITWLAGRGASAYRSVYAQLVAGLVNEVIDEAGIGESWIEMFGRALPGRTFDLVIDTQEAFGTMLAVRGISTRQFVSSAGGFLLSSVRPGPETPPMPVAPVHRLLWLLALTSGIAPDPFAPLPMSGEVLRLAETLMPSGGLYLALTPGLTSRGQSWPLESFARAARSLIGNGWRPAFFLTPEESLKREEIAAAVPGAIFPLQQPQARRYNGRPDLTVALAGRCQAALVAPSDMAHLLAIAGMPMVALTPDSYPLDLLPFASRLDRLTPSDCGAPGGTLDRIPPSRALQAVSDLMAPPPAPPPAAPPPSASTRRVR
ncbi:glycosyltransferase family 9 protein [Lacibacterium aquatile]|uniref:Glycosyltransferase family 9 protein n=1 Tax=Lacibacterium aquatile TaxID=1168082 RepID=A0ABW5DT98_9PROT